MIGKLEVRPLRPHAAVWPSIAHLFVFWGFAVAQPIYDIFGKYADFFVAHSAQPLDVLFLVVLVSVAIPAALGVAEWVAHLVHRRAQQAVHGAFVGTLLVLAVLPLFKKVSALSSTAVTAGSFAVGAGLLLLYLAVSAVRQVMTYGVIAAVIFPVSFVLFTPVRQIVFRKPPAQETSRPAASIIDAPPIVFIVFDELPLVSLLDETRTIDRVRYPNFAQLASEAHWFRNFTTNGPNTVWSLPSILTGKYTAEQRLLTAEANPESLFTLLGPTYDIVPFGALLLDMCPDRYVSTLYKPSSSLRMRALLRDISTVYLHIVLPPGLSAELPPVTDNWRDFAASGPRDDEDREELDRFTEKNPALLFRRFIQSFKPSSKPTLYILKTLLIHNPWKFMPSGRQYYPTATPGLFHDRAHLLQQEGVGGKQWSRDEWLVTQGYQRHLLELGAADALLGEVTAKLKELNMYEKSMVVVMSDHGCSFTPDARNRGDKNTFAADTMPVPFILKVPHQREGAVSDENVEAIDILPTIAAVLKIPLPFSTDGQSAFDTSKPRRQQKTLLFQDTRYVVAAANESKYASLQKKLAIFGSGGTRPDGYFAIGPYGAVVGQAPSAFERAATPIRFAFNEKSLFARVETTDENKLMPCYVSGHILVDKPGAEPLHLAISVNGTIRAVTRTYRASAAETDHFYAIIPDTALREGKNVLDFYGISRDNDMRIRLTPLVEDRDDLPGQALAGPGRANRPAVPSGRKGKLTIKTGPRNSSFQGWVVNAKGLPAIEKVVVFANDRPVLTIAVDGPVTGKGEDRAGRRNRAFFTAVTRNDILPDRERVSAFAFAGEDATEIPVTTLP